MPPIKLKYVVSFTSEDPKHRAANLLSDGIWICSPNEQSTSIKAEFQLEKATKIDYIDIGNYNSAMLCIEVGMSTWPSSQMFLALLPTVVLMTPSECRSGQNSKSVRMFKKENLDKNNVTKEWDRIRVTCFQPFKRNIQYGLTFLKIYSHSETVQQDNALTLSEIEARKKKENLIFTQGSIKSAQKVMPESLKSLESCRIDNDSSSSQTRHSSQVIKSPISRAGKCVMSSHHIPNNTDARQQKKELECEALTFMISLNLTSQDIHSLKVSHIREEFERRRGSLLNTREKLIFKNIALDYATRRLQTLEQQKDNPLSLSDENTEPPSKKTKSSPQRFTFKRNIVASRHPASERNNQPSSSDGGMLHRKDVALMDSVVTDSGSPRTARGPVGNPSFGEQKTPKRLSRGEHGISPRLRGDKKVNSLSAISFELEDDSASFSPERDSSEADFRSASQTKGCGTLGSPQRLTECPLCAEHFPSDSIERHAATCEGGSPSVVIIGGSPPKSPSQRTSSFEECPICGILINFADLEQHAAECAEKTFST